MSQPAFIKGGPNILEIEQLWRRDSIHLLHNRDYFRQLQQTVTKPMT